MVTGNDKVKSMTITRKEMNKGRIVTYMLLKNKYSSATCVRQKYNTISIFFLVHEEYLFLQHLELDPAHSGKESDSKKSGRTPFTTTHKLTRQSGSSYGFSIAWTHPPRYTTFNEII